MRRQDDAGRARGDDVLCREYEHGITNTGKVPMTFYWSKWLAKAVTVAALSASASPIDLEDVAVDRLPEEEALERRGAQRLESSAPRSRGAP